MYVVFSVNHSSMLQEQSEECGDTVLSAEISMDCVISDVAEVRIILRMYLYLLVVQICSMCVCLYMRCSPCSFLQGDSKPIPVSYNILWCSSEVGTLMLLELVFNCMYTVLMAK